MSRSQSCFPRVRARRRRSTVQSYRRVPFPPTMLSRLYRENLVPRFLRGVQDEPLAIVFPTSSREEAAEHGAKLPTRPLPAYDAFEALPRKSFPSLFAWRECWPLTIASPYEVAPNGRQSIKMTFPLSAFDFCFFTTFYTVRNFCFYCISEISMIQ